MNAHFEWICHNNQPTRRFGQFGERRIGKISQTAEMPALSDVTSQMNSPVGGSVNKNNKTKGSIRSLGNSDKENFAHNTKEVKLREQAIKQRSVTTLPLMVRFMEILQKGIEIQKRSGRDVVQQRVLWLGKGCTTLYCGKTKNCAKPKTLPLCEIENVSPHTTDINWLSLQHNGRALEIAVLTLRTRDWLVNVLSKLIQNAQAPTGADGSATVDYTALIEASFKGQAKKQTVVMDLVSKKKLGFILEPISPDLSEAKQTNDIFSASSSSVDVKQSKNHIVEMVQINGAEPGSIGHRALENGDICISDILYSIGGIVVLGLPIEAIFEIFKKERSYIRKAHRQTPSMIPQMEMVILRSRKAGLPGTPIQKGSI